MFDRCKVCLKSPGTDVGAAGFGMGVPGLLRQTLLPGSESSLKQIKE